MKNTISILTIAAFVAALASSCNTDKNEAPTISIESPSADNNPYHSGNPIHIHVNYADDDQLHEVTLTIVRDMDTTEVYHFHGHPDAATYTLEVDTMFTTTDHSDFLMTATATDHDDVTTTETATFHMHPM